MKNFLMMIFSLVVLTSATVIGGEEVVDALKSGNAVEVAAYFDNFIDLTLPEKEEIQNMSKNQATVAFKSFYQENGINGFNLTSQRENGATMYITGKLTGKIGSKNITLMLKNSNGKYSIISVRIS
jgi:opacity protein-like surface antigen